MEAKLAQSLQISTWNDSEKITRKPNGSLHFSPRSREPKGFRILISNHLQPTGTATWHKPEALRVSCSYRNYPGRYKIYQNYFLKDENMPFFPLLFDNQ